MVDPVNENSDNKPKSLYEYADRGDLGRILGQLESAGIDVEKMTEAQKLRAVQEADTTGQISINSSTPIRSGFTDLEKQQQSIKDAENANAYNQADARLKAFQAGQLSDFDLFRQAEQEAKTRGVQITSLDVTRDYNTNAIQQASYNYLQPFKAITLTASNAPSSDISFSGDPKAISKLRTEAFGELSHENKPITEQTINQRASELLQTKYKTGVTLEGPNTINQDYARFKAGNITKKSQQKELEQFYEDNPNAILESIQIKDDGTIIRNFVTNIRTDKILEQYGPAKPTFNDLGLKNMKLPKQDFVQLATSGTKFIQSPIEKIDVYSEYKNNPLVKISNYYNDQWSKGFTAPYENLGATGLSIYEFATKHKSDVQFKPELEGESFSIISENLNKLKSGQQTDTLGDFGKLGYKIIQNPTYYAGSAIGSASQWILTLGTGPIAKSVTLPGKVAKLEKALDPAGKIGVKIEDNIVTIGKESDPYRFGVGKISKDFKSVEFFGREASQELKPEIPGYKKFFTEPFERQLKPAEQGNYLVNPGRVTKYSLSEAQGLKTSASIEKTISDEYSQQFKQVGKELQEVGKELELEQAKIPKNIGAQRSKDLDNFIKETRLDVQRNEDLTRYSKDIQNIGKEIELGKLKPAKSTNIEYIESLGLISENGKLRIPGIAQVAESQTLTMRELNKLLKTEEGFRTFYNVGKNFDIGWTEATRNKNIITNVADISKLGKFEAPNIGKTSKSAQKVTPQYLIEKGIVEVKGLGGFSGGPSLTASMLNPTAKVIKESIIDQKVIQPKNTALGLGGNAQNYTVKTTLGLGGLTGVERKKKTIESNNDYSIDFIANPEQLSRSIIKEMQLPQSRQNNNTGQENITGQLLHTDFSKVLGLDNLIRLDQSSRNERSLKLGQSFGFNFETGFKQITDQSAGLKQITNQIARQRLDTDQSITTKQINKQIKTTGQPDGDYFNRRQTLLTTFKLDLPNLPKQTKIKNESTQLGQRKYKVRDLIELGFGSAYAKRFNKAFGIKAKQDVYGLF